MYRIEKSKYNIGDKVKLSKGTLLHGTYKNIDVILINDASCDNSFFLCNQLKQQYSQDAQLQQKIFMLIQPLQLQHQQ